MRYNLEAGTQYATVRDLLRAFAFYRNNPNGTLRVDWCTSWNEAEFRRWFSACLNRKIHRNDTRTGRRLSEAYQQDLALDAQIIRDAGRNIVRRGFNLLRTPEMKARFPHIDNNPCEC